MRKKDFLLQVFGAISTLLKLGYANAGGMYEGEHTVGVSMLPLFVESDGRGPARGSILSVVCAR
jgi:hypothetical protein